MAVMTLNVVMVISEAMPFSKTGGLGDVGGALPAALARLGHRVRVVVPCYPGSPAGTRIASFASGAWLGSPQVGVIEHVGSDGVSYRFVDCPDYFGRDGIYGTVAGDYEDNDHRFALLARTAFEVGIRLGGPVAVVPP